MAEATPLETLAALAGIERGYYDIYGTWNKASDETLERLLDSMGYQVGDAAALATALRDREIAPWREVMPPVQVVRHEAQPVRLQLSLGTARIPETMACRIVLEDGTERSETLDLAASDVMERTEIEGVDHSRILIPLPVGLPKGYHTVSIEGRPPDGGAEIAAETRLIIVPDRAAPVPAAGDARRHWGVTVQVYSLYHTPGQPIGTYGDLARVAGNVARAGGSFVGINPVHALFPADPGHFSPYSPSSRVYLNTVYDSFDGGLMPERTDGVVPDANSAGVGAEGLVDYRGAYAAGAEALDAAWERFKVEDLASGSDRAAAFEAYCDREGQALDRHAVFEVLHADFFGRDPGLWDWRSWPDAFRDPSSPEVAEFREARIDQVMRAKFAQWRADTDLAHAADRARDEGAAIGLYRDLAVATHPGGADPWRAPASFAYGVAVGAPPDAFNVNGQNWGLVPFSPEGLRATAYRDFIACVRANMRHAGAIRIDHVMALAQLFWIPDGMSAREGAYVRYPLDDLLGIIALESERAGCVVIGEDLGTVPAGFRERLNEAGVLSCAVLMFERGADARFTMPTLYPERSMASLATHDLPTFAGFWAGRDIAWREALGHLDDESARDHAWNERARDRRLILDMLDEAGLVPPGWSSGEPADRADRALIAAIHGVLARSKSLLVMVQLEDALGLEEQPNIPGTTTEHPNWRRRLPCTVDAVFEDETALAVFEAMRNRTG